MLLGSCSSAARPLQYYCISHAALLQRPCSRTAKAVQQTCRGEAEKTPRQGSPPVPQSVPSGQVRSAQDGREESGRLPLGYCSWARDLCAIFTSKKTVVRVQSVFALPPCRLAVAFVEGVAGYGETWRQTRCRQRDESNWKVRER